MKLLNLILLLVGIGTIVACSQNSGGKLENINAKEFAEKTKSKNAVIIDVRTPQEVAQGYLEGTQYFFDINDPKFEEYINKLDKTKEYFVYCKSGGRGSRAAIILQNNGFTKVYNLSGGIGAWNGKLAFK